MVEMLNLVVVDMLNWYDDGGGSVRNFEMIW